VTTGPDRTEAAERAARLQAAGLQASDDGRPALAVRRLRAALRILGAASEHAETRSRILVSLAWAESERGHVELAFRLLDEAEPLAPAARRPVVHAQRAVLLNRNGRGDLALAEFDRAIAGLTERDDPLDLAKALNNRSVLHRGAGRIGAARDDLRRSLGIADRHRMELGSALIRFNLGCLDVVAGDLPHALRAFAAARTDYERIAPGRLPTIAIEMGRALVAAGLFREADAELASAVDQARELRQNHVHADALQTRAEVALLAGRPTAAAEWARQAHADFLRRGNPRRTALTALLVLRAEYAAPDVRSG
jgi:tetratricopeptide (TPR) repeat protein